MIDVKSAEQLLDKYITIINKMNKCAEIGNAPMYETYKHQAKAVRMVLGILGITISGING